MSESGKFWSLIIPWTGGTIAAWGDLSLLGIGWGASVAIVTVIIHSRVIDRHNPKGPSRYAQAKTSEDEK